MKKTEPEKEIFLEEMARLENDPAVVKMKEFSQHRGNNTYQHSRNVAYRSYSLAKVLHWKIDERSLARGAMLHDYYMYSTKDMEISAYRHGTGHPKRALANARTRFHLNPKEENIIISHMWPLTLFHPPRSREAILVCISDKYCAVREMVLRQKNLTGNQKNSDKKEKERS